MGNLSKTETPHLPVVLQRLGVSLADWIRMTGWLRSDVADEGTEQVPDEYRDLVKRYFLEIARRGQEEER